MLSFVFVAMNFFVDREELATLENEEKMVPQALRSVLTFSWFLDYLIWIAVTTKPRKEAYAPRASC